MSTATPADADSSADVNIDVIHIYVHQFQGYTELLYTVLESFLFKAFCRIYVQEMQPLNG